MMQNINHYLTDMTSVVLAVSVLVGVFYFRQINSISIRFLIAYLAFGTIVDIILECCKVPGTLIRGMYCVMLPVEYVIYVYMFKEKIGSNRFLRFLVIFSALCLSCFGLYQVLFNIEQKSAATVVFRIMGFLTMILVLLYFRALLLTNDIISLSREPLFWIATCLLIFFTGNIIPTGFYHLFYAQSKTAAPKIFILNFSLNMLRYGGFCKAFILATKEKNG